MSRRTDLEAKRLELQAALDAGKTSAERNRLGQFATPPALAADILAYGVSLLKSRAAIRFLDPAIGTGSFYSALRKTVRPSRIRAAVGFEIDAHYGGPALDLWKTTSLDIQLADFTSARTPETDAERFNLVVCNPPYVRHHYITRSDKMRMQEATERVTGVRIGGLSGLYCYFLALSHGWLSSGGVAGWLIPSEFMDVGYGRDVKRYLLDRVKLLRIHRFDPDDVQFDDALVSSAVVWFSKEEPPADHRVEFTFGGSLAEPRDSRMVAPDELAREPKWTRFPKSGVRTRSNGVTLADFFTVKRGIATGANRFFILSREQIKKSKLPMDCFRPVLPSPRFLPDDEVQADADGNPVLARRVFLLNCRVPESVVRTRYPKLWRYLQSGEPDVSGRYLCRHREPWYSQEDRTPAPFLCTYMGRNGKNGRPFRMILNHSRATVANVYLLLYPKPFLARELKRDPGLARRIWMELKQLTPQTFTEEGRVYGGGLYKMEPKELANVPASRLLAVVPAPKGQPSCQRELFCVR